MSRLPSALTFTSLNAVLTAGAAASAVRCFSVTTRYSDGTTAVRVPGVTT